VLYFMGMVSVILGEIYTCPLSTPYLLKTCNFELNIRKSNIK
jgi:hypothetical protein